MSSWWADATHSPPSSVLQLPTAVLVSVLSFLPLSSLTSSSSVCALLFVLSQEDRLWRQLCLRRWRLLQPYLRYRLLPRKEWAEVDGEEVEGGMEEEEKAAPPVAPLRSVVGGQAAAEGEGEEDEEPSLLSEGGWKARYIACEMDLCRALLTLPELLSHRWQFRFHFAFDDETSVSYPHFTKGWVRTGMGDNAYPWKWVDRVRLDTPRGSGDALGEALPYVRAGLVRRGAMERILTRPRGPYWLRSCGAVVTALTSSSSPAQPFDPTAAVPAPALHAGSALLSPSLPPHRYRPGHPFFTPTALQVKDCRTVRGMQVSHFPPLTITRLHDGGWQMLNQYVVMTTINPDTEAADEEAEAVEGQDGDDEVGVFVALVAFDDDGQDEGNESGGEDGGEGLEVDEAEGEGEAADGDGDVAIRGLDDAMDEQP